MSMSNSFSVNLEVLNFEALPPVSLTSKMDKNGDFQVRNLDFQGLGF